MRRKLYKELWHSRFKKMLKLEEQSIVDYENILQHCQKEHKDHSIVPSLKRLIADEKHHAQLVQELLGILDSQPD